MTDTFQQYLDNRPLRDKVQEDYVNRIIDGMDWKDLQAYAFDTLNESFNEQTDEDFFRGVKDVYPDLLENQ